MAVVSLWLLILSFSIIASASELIQIPLQFSKDNRRYVANVNMSTGDNTQRFGFALTTTTGYTFVADSSCTTCASNNVSTYDMSQSSSAAQIGSGQQQQTISIAGSTNLGTGALSKENCALKRADGGYWHYHNQTIVRSSASPLFQNGVSGLVGLGAAPPFGETIAGTWLRNNPAQQNFTFGLALNPPPTSQNIVPASSSSSGSGTADAGVLHMQQPDAAAIAGDIQWHPAQTMFVNGSANSSSSPPDSGGVSWVIQLDGWNLTAGESQASNKQGGQAILDPYFPSIFMPSTQAAQLYAAVSGAQAIQQLSPDAGQSFSVPCTTDMTFSVILGGQQYPVPKDALVLQNSDGSCVGAIEGWDAPFYLLGSRFISTVYMAFQVDRNSQQQNVGIGRRAQQREAASLGGIIGGTVGGGIAFVLLAGGSIFLFLRRRRRRAARGSAEMVRSRSPDASGEGTYLMASPSPNRDRDGWSAYAPTLPPVTPFILAPEPHDVPPTTPATAYTHSTTLSSTTPTVGSAGAYSDYSPQGPSFPATQPIPRLNQWVTHMRPTSGIYVNKVPTHYDYGNQNEPGLYASQLDDDDDPATLAKHVG